MQSSLTRHTIGPRIVSSEEDDYPLDTPSLPDFTKPAPRPLFDDGSDQGSDRGTLPTTSALLPLASSVPASPVPASSAPTSSAPASSIRASAVQAPAASSLNTTDIEEETELDS
ncbi:hypothetical protein C8Q72DRAFT_885520 [Fomitopsis betulina]|nr:hypothetical protein C8Q72DRAFT_885520 [Fomitopsis betulina]